MQDEYYHASVALRDDGKIKQLRQSMYITEIYMKGRCCPVKA